MADRTNPVRRGWCDEHGIFDSRSGNAEHRSFDDPWADRINPKPWPHTEIYKPWMDHPRCAECGPDVIWPCDAEIQRLRADRAEARVAALTEALTRLDAIARVDPLNERGEAELQAALDQSYWLLRPEQHPSALDRRVRAEAEARAATPEAEGEGR